MHKKLCFKFKLSLSILKITKFDILNPWIKSPKPVNKLSFLKFSFTLKKIFENSKNKDENIHRFALRAIRGELLEGEKEKERVRDLRNLEREA